LNKKKFIEVWKADHAILSSVFDLPPDRNIISLPPKEEDNANKSNITERTKMTIGEITIMFDDNKVSVRKYGDGQWDDRPLVYYLIYKTYLYYNCLMPENESTEITPEVERVTFKLHRYIADPVVDNGKTIYTEPCEIILSKREIADYLKVLDDTVLLAIVYYIRGCITHQYFLIEFYKCSEVIKNKFKSEKKMKKMLQPHGFREVFYKEAKKLANDQRKPLDVGRHAPLGEVSVQNIDTKWLFSDSIGRRAFETGERACRNTIDSYLQFLIIGKS
jgi:hypothetical protein